MKHSNILNYLILPPPPNYHETHVFKIICYNMIIYIYIEGSEKLVTLMGEAFRVKFIT
jgi:hypothetical protein